MRGHILAASARTKSDLQSAERSLEKAQAINPEETGTMLILGEVAIAMGDAAKAERRLEWVCSTNARAVGAFFLRAYIAWKKGDVRRQMHAEAAFLSSYWLRWDGSLEPTKAFDKLAAFLSSRN
jgi:lipopolysaccharide biosynthesis regulator YciM